MRRRLSLQIHRADHTGDSLGRIFLGVVEGEAALALVRAYLGPKGRLKHVELDDAELRVEAEVGEFEEESRNSLRMGREALRKSRPRAALGHYEEALKLSPWNPDALRALGRLYYQNRQTVSAKNLLIRAREANPTDATVLMLLAEIALHEDRRLAARAYLETVQRMDPQNPRVRRALARVRPSDLSDREAGLATIPEPPETD